MYVSKKISAPRKMFFKYMYLVVWGMFLFVLIIQILFAVLSYRMQKAQLTETGKVIIDSVELTIDSEMSDIKAVAAGLAFNESVSDALYSDTMLEKYRNRKEVSRLVNLVCTLNPNIKAIVLNDYDDNTNILLKESTYDSSLEKIISEKREVFRGSKNLTLVLFSHNDKKPEEHNLIFMTPFYRRDPNNYVSYIRKGNIAFLIDFTLFTDLFMKNNNYKDVIIEISDQYGETVTVRNDMKEQFNPDRHYYRVEKSIEEYGLSVRAFVPKSIHKKQTNMFFLWIAVTLIVFGLIYIILTLMIYKKLTKPLGQLIDQLKELHVFSRNKRLHIKNNNEIALIGNEINEMLDVNEKQTRQMVATQARLYELELGNREVQSYALQLQINPHFLYNTLQCVRAIALIKGVPDIAGIVTAMSKIYRYSTKGESIVTIREETGLMEEYIKICKIRYEHKFTIHYQEEIFQYKTIKMILQPIVENAIDHGLEPKFLGGVGEVKINGWCSGENLIFEIEDNGAGIDGKTLEEIKEGINKEYFLLQPQKHSKSIGIINVNTRIKCIYGKEYGLTITSGKEGTKVRILLPLMK